jgi:urocanate hydratase
MAAFEYAFDIGGAVPEHVRPPSCESSHPFRRAPLPGIPTTITQATAEAIDGCIR